MEDGERRVRRVRQGADAANTACRRHGCSAGKGGDISHQIEALFNTYMDGLMTRLSDNTDIPRAGQVRHQPTASSKWTRTWSPRYYAVTFVDDWGRESALSDPERGTTLDQNDTVTVECLQCLPGGTSRTGGCTVPWPARRRHRSALSRLTTSASTTRTIGAVSTTIYGYTDAKADAALGDAAITRWDGMSHRCAPRRGHHQHQRYLRGIAQSGGVVAGFLDNFVAFSEPNYPYAWPVKYQQPCIFPVVAVASLAGAVRGHQRQPVHHRGRPPGQLRAPETGRCAAVLERPVCGIGQRRRVLRVSRTVTALFPVAACRCSRKSCSRRMTGGGSGPVFDHRSGPREHAVLLVHRQRRRLLRPGLHSKKLGAVRHASNSGVP